MVCERCTNAVASPFGVTGVLNVLIDGAFTTFSGKVFQSVTTLLEK